MNRTSKESQTSNTKTKGNYSKASQTDPETENKTQKDNNAGMTNKLNTNSNEEKQNIIKDTNDNDNDNDSDSVAELESELMEFRKSYKEDIRQCFWLFAGHAPYAKTTLYMRKSFVSCFMFCVFFE